MAKKERLGSDPFKESSLDWIKNTREEKKDSKEVKKQKPTTSKRHNGKTLKRYDVKTSKSLSVKASKQDKVKKYHLFVIQTIKEIKSLCCRKRYEIE